MADSSPIFTPPRNSLVGDDPQIIRVPLDRTDSGFRKSQEPNGQMAPDQAVRNIPNSGGR